MNLNLLAVQITADEGSPYYQCEFVLRNPRDYTQFERDQPFTLHILGNTYSFVVDTKGLSRSIDDSGNLQETATITGLSPLCLKASPRAKSITKTWSEAKLASAIVEELIGIVTWNLVDWVIPAYRLSAEQANPLELAQQIANAAGGIIESQPDGSVVVRHRWPVSIASLDSASADSVLYETQIFAAQESPTNDDLINKVRILDSNAGYQDRLEYVPNPLLNADGSIVDRNNDDEADNDPWNGILYAYPSPWRDGLRIVTTRGSVIHVGAQSEGTKFIFDDPDDEDVKAEIIEFQNGQGSTQYPIMTLDSFEWLDENLGGITFTPYATTLEATGRGSYEGYSLAKVSYTTRYLSVPVSCIPSEDTIHAQFLLVENVNGDE